MILKETSITLKEHDELKANDPERYWELYYWLLKEKLEEKKLFDEKAKELKDRLEGNSSGSVDVATIREREPEVDDFYSEFIKGEDFHGMDG